MPAKIILAYTWMRSEAKYKSEANYGLTVYNDIFTSWKWKIHSICEILG